MLRILVFLIFLALAAFGVAWIADRPGDLVLTWQGYHIETSVGVALAIVVLAAVAIAVLWAIIRLIVRAPGVMRRRTAARRQAKGHAALSRGMIAVGSGDARLARKSAAEANRYLGDEPLAHLLNAQSAQLSGDRAAARTAFEKLAQMPQTRLLGLRGLHVEAQRSGDADMALFYAHEAHKIEPLPWSAKAVLEHHAAHDQWEAALAALESQISAKLIDKPTGERQRAVLETAIAIDKADRAPDEALRLARQALQRAPDLVPAAVVAARLLSRRGDMRKAAKLIEAAWGRQRHPDLAEAYLDLRPGDSNTDRLEKAQTLARLAPHDPESHMIVARAALVAHDYDKARRAMAPLVAEGERPSVRACLIMAELEDVEFGDQGQVREWLARSASAPRDPVWIADGVASQKWGPVSPLTGRLDAFVWQRPMERLSADIEAPEWVRHAALPEPTEPPASTPAETPLIEAVAEKADAPAEAGSAPAPEAEPIPARADAPASDGENEPVVQEQAAEPPPAAPQALRPRTGAQKVIFPLPAAPDDPGPDDSPSEPAEIRCIGRL
ncbi:MAG: heme biosynthesis protein HemY [Beijerinckiaceae bacterium]|nr:MAG: heme biosynthesis protein HemY [Beijerinckiaceae bacterium]